MCHVDGGQCGDVELHPVYSRQRSCSFGVIYRITKGIPAKKSCMSFVFMCVHVVRKNRLGKVSESEAKYDQISFVFL